MKNGIYKLINENGNKDFYLCSENRFYFWDQDYTEWAEIDLTYMPFHKITLVKEGIFNIGEHIHHLYNDDFYKNGHYIKDGFNLIKYKNDWYEWDLQFQSWMKVNYDIFGEYELLKEGNFNPQKYKLVLNLEKI